MNSTHLLTVILPLTLLTAACGNDATPTPQTPAAEAAAATPVEAPSAAPAATVPPSAAQSAAEAPPPVVPVEVAIQAKSGSKLSGTATFTQVDGGVKVIVKVAGAPPGQVATHVHAVGDCSAADGKSAGDHFNPENHKHGLPDGERHLGDLGNIAVAKDGTGSTELVVKGANLKAGDPDSFLGKAIIVHGKKDDGGQPAGNAGSRIGCGVIAAK
jgi:Cu-Zn family superoxide dismutase